MSSCYRWGELGAQVKIKVSKSGWVFLPLVKATVETFVCLVLLIGQSDYFGCVLPSRAAVRACCGCGSALESLSQDLIFQRVCGKTAKSAAALGCGVCNQQSLFFLLRKTKSHNFSQCWLFNTSSSHSTAFTSQGFL